MKVRELIEALQTVDPELDVIVFGSSGIESDITGVELYKYWHFEVKLMCLLTDQSWPAT